jgi:hypothetical protein
MSNEEERDEANTEPSIGVVSSVVCPSVADRNRRVDEDVHLRLALMVASWPKTSLTQATVIAPMSYSTSAVRGMEAIWVYQNESILREEVPPVTFSAVETRREANNKRESRLTAADSAPSGRSPDSFLLPQVLPLQICGRRYAPSRSKDKLMALFGARTFTIFGAPTRIAAKWALSFSTERKLSVVGPEGRRQSLTTGRFVYGSD